jgi:hypothetical protein
MLLDSLLPHLDIALTRICEIPFHQSKSKKRKCASRKRKKVIIRMKVPQENARTNPRIVLELMLKTRISLIVGIRRIRHRIKHKVKEISVLKFQSSF